MSNNLAQKIFQLSDFIFTEEEILNNGALIEDVYEIKNAGISIGYTLLSDLKLINAQGSHDWTGISIRQFESNDWKLLFEHPSFGRRKPQLIDTANFTNSEDAEIYVLQRGQKVGPYSSNEIATQIQNKDMLLTDLVSINGGLTWAKLYQVDGFNRRTDLSNEELPGTPRADFFNTISDSNKTDKDSIDAMSSLAYLGNLKRGKAFEREREELIDLTNNANNKSGVIYKFILVGSIFGIVYLAYNLKNSLKSPFAGNQNDSRIGEKIEDNTEMPKENFNSFNNKTNDMSRNNKFETRQLNPVRRPMNQRPINTNPKFRNNGAETAHFESAQEEQSYFYNDSAPMELDPVRSQISRETSEGQIGEPAPAPMGDPLFNQEIEN